MFACNYSKFKAGIKLYFSEDLKVLNYYEGTEYHATRQLKSYRAAKFPLKQYNAIQFPHQLTKYIIYLTPRQYKFCGMLF